MRRRIAAVVAVVVVAAGAGWLPGRPAGACSFAGAQVQAPEVVDAGGTLVVAGQGFFDIVGEVGADCGGDYEFVAMDDVVVTVTFETPGGPVVDPRPAPVTAGEPGDAERFTIGPFEFDVPPTATAATVTTSANTVPVTVEVRGGPTTTVTATTVPPVSVPPTPARPLRGEPTFTG